MPPEIVEFNEKIKKPYALKISPSGAFDLIISETRLKEVDDSEESGSNRRLQLAVSSDNSDEVDAESSTSLPSDA